MTKETSAFGGGGNHVNRRPPEEVLLADFLDWMMREIVGDGDPDGYLYTESEPTFDERLKREADENFSQTDKMS